MGPILLVLQAVSGPPAPVPQRRPQTDRPCPRGVDGDVVVCARSPDEFRLKPADERYGETTALPRAEIGVLGKSKLNLEAEQGNDAQGGAINRAMVRLKIPLGGKRKE